MRGIFKFLLPIPLTIMIGSVAPGSLSVPADLHPRDLASRIQYGEAKTMASAFQVSAFQVSAFQSSAWADAVRPNKQGQVLMADGINSTSTSVSSSSSSSVTTRQNTDGKPQVECNSSATATTDVNGQRKTDHSEKTVHDADNGCSATSSAHATTSPDPQTKTEAIIQQNTE